MNIMDAYISSNNEIEELNGFDEQRILLNSLQAVFPLIMEKELTEKQCLCLKMYCVEHMSQHEIAKKLKLSQPTVSRHINVAKKIINKHLNYCYYSLRKANEQWLRVY